MKAIEQGLARVKKSRDELLENALSLIRRARDQTQSLMQDGFIRPPPP